MFKDLKNFSNQATLKYDVCIVGSGVAGLSVAKQLLKTNRNIVILESGGMEPESRYLELNEGKNSGPKFLDLDSSRLRCFGGAGQLWAGHCAPFERDDFEKKSYLSYSGWPISFDDLEDYYKEASGMLGISHKKFYNDDLIGNTRKEKSFKEINQNNSFITTQAIQYAGKYRDFSRVYKKDFKESENTDIIFHSTVTNLNVINDGNTVSSVSVSDLDGHKATIEAKIIVLAAGALENPRILLVSNNYHKKGIGNSHKLVGTCFMSHPGISNTAQIYKTAFNECFINTKDPVNYRRVFAVSNHGRIKSQILKSNLSFNDDDLLTKQFNEYRFFKLNNQPCEGENSKNVPSVWNLNCALEQPPRLANYMKLDSMKDALGMPKISMHWDNLSKIEKDTVLKTIKYFARTLGISGTGKIRLTKEFLNGEVFDFDDSINHHIGTTRMSDNPKTGVVDKNCKVFGLSNLYIAGSSVFPTASNVGPTYTIIALSLKLGKYIKNIQL